MNPTEDTEQYIDPETGEEVIVVFHKKIIVIFR